MPPFITPASHNPPGNAIGDRTLTEILTTFLKNVYPTVAFVDTTPTSVTVYHLTATTTSTATQLAITLRNLKLSDVVLLLKEFNFELYNYQTGAVVGTYTVTGSLPTSATAATFNGGTFDSNFGTLWLVDLVVDLLKQISFTITKSGGTPTNYRVIGTLEDYLEVNPDLKTPLGGFSPKYLFLLKKFFNFSAQQAGQPATVASRIVACNGNKILGE